MCARTSFFYNTLSPLLWALSEQRPKSLLELCRDLTPPRRDLGFVKPKVNLGRKRIHCFGEQPQYKVHACMHTFFFLYVLGLRRFIHRSATCQKALLDECAGFWVGAYCKNFKLLLLIYLLRNWFFVPSRCFICIEEMNCNLARVCVSVKCNYKGTLCHSVSQRLQS